VVAVTGGILVVNLLVGLLRQAVRARLDRRVLELRLSTLEPRIQQLLQARATRVAELRAQHPGVPVYANISIRLIYMDAPTDLDDFEPSETMLLDVRDPQVDVSTTNRSDTVYERDEVEGGGIFTSYRATYSVPVADL
jgi:hypothetical protein